MLWNNAKHKRKILYRYHSFWLILILPFIFGVLSGVIFCRLGASVFNPAVIKLAPEAEESSCFLSVFTYCIRFPFLLFVFSFSSYSCPLIFGTLFIRGFFISYSISGYLYSLGLFGLLYGFVLNLFQGIIILPLIMILAAWGLLKSNRSFDSRAVVMILFTFVFVLMIAAAEFWITPLLLKLINFLFG